MPSLQIKKRLQEPWTPGNLRGRCDARGIRKMEKALKKEMTEEKRPVTKPTIAPPNNFFFEFDLPRYLSGKKDSDDEKDGDSDSSESESE